MQVMLLPIDQVAFCYSWRPGDRGSPPDSEDEDEDDGADAAAQPPMPAWLHMLHLPRSCWRHLTLNEPRACKASIAGVDLTLTAFGERMTGPGRQSPTAPQHTQPASSAPASASTPAENPFSPHPATFTFGTNTGPSNRRRKRIRGAGGGHPGQQGQPGSSSSSSQQEEAWPTERHVILQSWGAGVRLTVQPPDWDDSKAAARHSAVEQEGQPHSTRQAPGLRLRHWSDSHHPGQPQGPRMHGPRMNGMPSPAGHGSPAPSFASSPRRLSSSGSEPCVTLTPPAMLMRSCCQASAMAC